MTSKYSAEAIVDGCFAEWLTRMNDILSVCFGYFSAGLLHSAITIEFVRIKHNIVHHLGDVKEEAHSQVNYYIIYHFRHVHFHKFWHSIYQVLQQPILN